MSILKDLMTLNESSTEDKADSLIQKIADGTGITYSQIRKAFQSGPGPDTSTLEKLEKDGYNSGEAWFANKDWFKKHGVTKAEYDAVCDLCESQIVTEALSKKEIDEILLNIAHSNSVSLKNVKLILSGNPAPKTALAVFTRGGFDPDGGWEENKKWADTHHLTKSEFNALRKIKLDESVQLDEGKEYSDSGDFDSDMDDVLDHLKKAFDITHKAEWQDWMKETQKNYSYSAIAKAAKVSLAIKRALDEANQFYDDMSDLG